MRDQSSYFRSQFEIENALLAHPSVSIAAVVGLPDPDRTELVAAYVKLADGWQPSEELVGELIDFVRDTLAWHEVPRRIEFVQEIPLTATGKVRRKTLRDQVLAAES